MKLEDQLAAAYRRACLENTRLINLLRLVAVGIFTGVSVTFVVTGSQSWKPLSGGLGIYLSLALLVWIAAGRNEKNLWRSRLCVPVLDIPMFTAVQLHGMGIAPHPGHISEFSISVYICLLMLAAMTLYRSLIYWALGLAILGEQLIQLEAGIGTQGRIVSMMIMAVAAWICVHAGKKRLSLVRDVARAQTKRQRLQRYFSPGIGEMIEDVDGSDLEQGKECELTLIVTDIRGFTALSEALDGRQTVALLNEVHSQMVEVLFRHAGTLDKYMGDGLLAYFNAPIGQKDHALRAIRCAQEMLATLHKINDQQAGAITTPLRMGIGIHTGRAIVGDIGAPNRREFTAIGDAVNVTSRLEALTKELGYELLVSQATAALLTEGPALAEIGEFKLRGRTEELRLFTSA